MQPTKKIDWGKRVRAMRKRRGEPAADESRAEYIVATLLDHCGDCPEDRELAIGTELEKEHFRGGKPKDTTPREVAATHLGENPHYYPLSKKPKGAKEALRWVKGNSAMPKPKGSFYPSSGGPSSL